MSKKLSVVVVLLLIITNIVVIYCYYNGEKKIDTTNVDSLLIANDSLNTVNELLNNKVDSLLIEIGKVDSIIVEINNTYEKDSNNIINHLFFYFFSSLYSLFITILFYILVMS